jgi:hypothetical protein
MKYHFKTQLIQLKNIGILEKDNLILNGHGTMSYYCKEAQASQVTKSFTALIMKLCLKT